MYDVRSSFPGTVPFPNVTTWHGYIIILPHVLVIILLHICSFVFFPPLTPWCQVDELLIVPSIYVRPSIPVWVWRNLVLPCTSQHVSTMASFSRRRCVHLISDYPFSQDILLITGSVLFFGEQVTPMQVFGEFNWVLRFLPSSAPFFLVGKLQLFYVQFAVLASSFFTIALLLEFLCSHILLSCLAIRTLGEGRRYIGCWINH